jgi:hypothetical protein
MQPGNRVARRQANRVIYPVYPVGVLPLSAKGPLEPSRPAADGGYAGS